MTDGPFAEPFSRAWTEPMTLVSTSSAKGATKSRKTVAAGCSKPDGDGASVRSFRNCRSEARIGATHFRLREPTQDSTGVRAGTAYVHSMSMRRSETVSYTHLTLPT